jgi:hypothetical protein
MSLIYPVEERIALQIAFRVAQVSKVNGYQVDLAGVVRPKKLGGYTPQDRLAVLVQEDPDPDLTNAMPAEAEVRVQSFLIALFVAPSDRDATPVDTLTNLLAADVHKAVMTDPNTDAPWSWLADDEGQLAISARFLAPQSFQTKDGSFEGRVLDLSVRYAHVLGDPYTVFTTS